MKIITWDNQVIIRRGTLLQDLHRLRANYNKYYPLRIVTEETEYESISYYNADNDDLINITQATYNKLVDLKTKAKQVKIDMSEVLKC